MQIAVKYVNTSKRGLRWPLRTLYANVMLVMVTIALAFLIFDIVQFKSLMSYVFLGIK